MNFHPRKPLKRFPLKGHSIGKLKDLLFLANHLTEREVASYLLREGYLERVPKKKPRSHFKATPELKLMLLNLVSAKKSWSGLTPRDRKRIVQIIIDGHEASVRKSHGRVRLIPNPQTIEQTRKEGLPDNVQDSIQAHKEAMEEQLMRVHNQLAQVQQENTAHEKTKTYKNLIAEEYKTVNMILFLHNALKEINARTKKK